MAKKQRDTEPARPFTKIRLLEDIHEHDRHGESVGTKTTRRRNRAWSPPVQVHGQWVSSKEPEFIDTRWEAGAVIDVSEATAQKFIESGRAVGVAD